MTIQPINNSLTFKNCPLCNSGKISMIGDIDYFSPVYYSTIEIHLTRKPELWKCRNCESKFVQNVITKEDSKKLYGIGNSEKKWKNRAFEDYKTDIVVNQLEQLLKTDMKVLDIGCSTGEFLDFAKLKGCKTYGLEYSKSCIDILRKKGHIASSNIEELGEGFDIITGFDLLEHLYDLPDFLSVNIEKLSEEGIMVFVTGDANSLPARLAGANWWYPRFPEHIIFSSRRYFEMYITLELLNWIPTYAGSGYQASLLKVIKSNLKALLTHSFSGFHTPIPDHALIVLKKVNQSESSPCP